MGIYCVENKDLCVHKGKKSPANKLSGYKENNSWTMDEVNIDIMRFKHNDVNFEVTYDDR